MQMQLLPRQARRFEEFGVDRKWQFGRHGPFDVPGCENGGFRLVHLHLLHLLLSLLCLHLHLLLLLLVLVIIATRATGNASIAAAAVAAETRSMSRYVGLFAVLRSRTGG